MQGIKFDANRTFHLSHKRYNIFREQKLNLMSIYNSIHLLPSGTYIHHWFMEEVIASRLHKEKLILLRLIEQL